MAFYFDSHAHYDDNRFDADREAVIAALREAGVRAVMNFEWILLLLAIFLPVAASGRLAQDAPSSVVSFDFVVIGVLVLIVGIVMAIFTVIGKYKERKFYEHHHRNP